MERPRSRASFLKTLGVGTAAASVAGLAAGTQSARAADEDLATHVAATTDVHGIPDTSVLSKYTTAGTFTRPQEIAPDTGAIPLVLRAGGGGTDLLRMYDSANNVAARFDSGGYLQINQNDQGEIHSFVNIGGASHRAGVWTVSGENGNSRGTWALGIDTAAAVPYRDFFIGKILPDGRVNDVFYINHRGSNASTFGIGWVGGRGDYRLNVSGEDSEPQMGGIAIRVANHLTTGQPLAFIDSSSGQPSVWFDGKYRWNSSTAGFRINAANSAYPRTGLVLADSDGTSNMFYFRHESNGSFRFRSWPASKDLFEVHPDAWRHMAPKLGFYGAAPSTKPIVTGSREGGAALRSLLSALSQLGLVVDQTTG